MTDPLSDILSGVDVRGSVFCYGEVREPWCFEGGAKGSCLFHAVVEGEAWLQLDDAPARRLGPGDVMLLTQGRTHRLGSRERRRATPLRRAVEHRPGDPFARLAVGGEGQPSYLICGTFEVDGLRWHPLLQRLPDLVVVNAGLGRWLPATLGALHNQLEHSQLGSAFVAARLAEVLFVQVVAAWLSSQSDEPMLADPKIGRAIDLMHREPGRGWSVPMLAREVGMSRSAFFERFSSLVGQSPAAYLKRWRMLLARRALLSEDVTLGELADRLGYGSESSLSRAFRDVYEVAPGNVRRESSASERKASRGRSSLGTQPRHVS